MNFLYFFGEGKLIYIIFWLEVFVIIKFYFVVLIRYFGVKRRFIDFFFVENRGNIKYSVVFFF